MKVFSMRLKHCQWISKDNAHLWPSSDYFPDAMDASNTANSCRVCSITLGVQVEVAAWGLEETLLLKDVYQHQPKYYLWSKLPKPPLPSTGHKNAKAIIHLVSAIQLLYSHIINDELRTGGNSRL